MKKNSKNCWCVLNDGRLNEEDSKMANVENRKAYKSLAITNFSSFRTVSMSPSNLKGLLDVYFLGVFGGVF